MKDLHGGNIYKFQREGKNDILDYSSNINPLGVQFGGRITYFGKDYEKQKIGDKLKEFDYEDIKKAVNILYVVSLIATISFIMVSIIIVLLG